MTRLRDQVAVVTGESGGLGGRIAVALAQAGSAVIVHYLQHTDAAQIVVRTIEQAGGRAKAVRGDLSQPDEAAAVIAAAGTAFGRLDILVNTVGPTRDGLVLRMNDEDWRAVITGNLTSSFYCIRAALREFVRQRRGRIINIASPTGQAGHVGQANYVAAKAGVIGLTRAVAREVGSRGITVNAIVPGVMAAGVSVEASARDLDAIPLGRLGTAADVAAAVVFLAAADAGYLTGQVLNVDGGMNMH